MEHNYINLFSIDSDFTLKLSFDDKITYLYKWIIDIYCNRINLDWYPYTIVDYFEYDVNKVNYWLIKQLFWVDYSDEHLYGNIIWNYKLLQIEWDLTVYILYKEKILLSYG